MEDIENHTSPSNNNKNGQSYGASNLTKKRHVDTPFPSRKKKSPNNYHEEESSSPTRKSINFYIGNNKKSDDNNNNQNNKSENNNLKMDDNGKLNLAKEMKVQIEEGNENEQHNLLRQTQDISASIHSGGEATPKSNKSNSAGKEVSSQPPPSLVHNEHEMEWNTIVQECQNGNNNNNNQASNNNVSEFIRACANRKETMERFLEILDQCRKGMFTGIEEMLHDVVVPVHEHQRNKYDMLEEDLLDKFKTNHKRRKDFQHRLELADEAHKKRHSKLMQRLLMANDGTANSPSDEESFETEQGRMSETANGSNPKGYTSSPSSMQDINNKNDSSNRNDNSSSNNANNNDHDNHDSTNNSEPNWDELALFEPSRENIQKYLEARQRLQNAELQLSQSLDEIHSGLRASMECIIEVAVEMHAHYDAKCSSSEEDIKFNLINNHKRQAQLEKQIAESAKKTEGLFARLFSRLTRNS